MSNATFSTSHCHLLLPTIPSVAKRLLAVTLLAVACGHVHGDESPFVRKVLADGISVDIPSHWVVLSAASRSNVEARTRAIIDSSGQSSSKAQTLLAVNATPAPTGAMIRISVAPEVEYTEAQLDSTNLEDLKSIAKDAEIKFKALEREGGIRLVKVLDPRIEKVGSRTALLLPYERTSLVGPSNWIVQQHYIPFDSRTVVFTLSYRRSDAPLWEPIIKRVKQSIRFEP